MRANHPIATKETETRASGSKIKVIIKATIRLVANDKIVALVALMDWRPTLAIVLPIPQNIAARITSMIPIVVSSIKNLADLRLFKESPFHIVH